jgi:hypothetical protein
MQYVIIINLLLPEAAVPNVLVVCGALWGCINLVYQSYLSLV